MHWTLNGEPVFVDGERVSLKALGQILAIKKVQMSDSGEYACELWAGNDQLARQTAVIMVDFRADNMLYGVSKGMQQQKSNRSSGTSMNELY
uniref:Ig-like domain-containing protein n=1 Tax=Angiostrongylus cantonensis TaxID=6313 RepID=A0A0K0D646_ANGCA